MSSDYEVGYKKPPKHGQFKKGQSGNPKGKPKGTRNLKTDLQEELQETIRIKEAGTGKSVSKQRALIKSMMAKAVGGDIKAATLLLNMFLKLVPDDAGIADDVDLTETDVAILEDFRKEVLKSATKKGKTNDQ